MRRQIERKLAPFWRGLDDWSSSWAEHQLVAAARGLPIPAADDPPDPALVPPPPPTHTHESHYLQNLTVPMGPRTLSAASDRSASGSGAPSPTAASTAKSLVKPRAKALAAALSISSRNASSTDLAPKEISLPYDPYVNGQPMEVNLYKDAIDCPICFLSYPPYLNQTRCCDQPICSECFVQIKRAEPHLPEHHPDGEARDPNEPLRAEDPPEMLMSEPSACPYCQQPEFGVTYEPPPFRRGLVYSASTSNLASSTAMSSQSSLNSTMSPASPALPGRRRGHSLSATAPNVITTDRVRPDWATKLATARAHQARRAAAATALHTAAFLVGTNDNRSMLRSGRFGRRSNGTNTPGQDQTGNGADAFDLGEHRLPGRNADGTRRSRVDELEDVMLMEAVRLSIAAEEERQRKEEKALRKEAKKRMQAERKAQKKQGKSPYGEHGSGASGSSLSLGGLGRKRGNSGASALRVEATISGASQAGDSSPATEPGTPCEGPATKGKGVDRGTEGSEEHSSALPIPNASRGGSHLRQLSNASSIGSSLADTPTGSYTGAGLAGPDGTASRDGEGERNNDSEPLFNFRSLAELVGVNLDDGSTQEQEGEAATTVQMESLGRPLSQVREEKESMEAEHVESADLEQDYETTQVPTASQAGDTEAGASLFPKVTITPGTPLPTDDVEAEGKQLGHTGVTTEHSQVAQ